MDKIETVKQGLKICTDESWLGDCVIGGKRCPYAEDHVISCYTTMCRDALSVIEQMEQEIDLLKEQEARILQWDEIKDYPVVYGEFKGVADIYPLIITLDNFGRCLSWNPEINVSSEYLLLVSDEEDRKDTRCWNKMPTDEQRQAVKWE